MNDIPSFVIRARPQGYACGTETIEHILRAAVRVLENEGWDAFTLRRIASECGLTVGNLSYHFATKEILVLEMIEALLNGYRDMFDDLVHRLGLPPEERLVALIHLNLDDIRSRRATRLFPELWALANRNPLIEERVLGFYRHAHTRMGETIRALNPALDAEESRAVAMYISASIEGTALFAGEGKPWEPQMHWVKAMAVEAMVHLARTITREKLRALEPRHD